MARTAAILVVGNEILSGKIADANVAFLSRELFTLGIALRRVVVCPDEVDVIARDVDALRRSHDVVITTGGVGPTHDDVTIAGVAAAFGRAVVRPPELVAMLTGHYKERLTDGHLRMASVPDGAELLASPEIPWPTPRVENVYVFPGVPDLVRLKFPLVRARLEDGATFVTRAVYTLCDEGEIASLLDRIVAAHPDVAVGSYPQWRGQDYKTKLTFDGKDLAAVERAVAAFIAAIPKEKIVGTRMTTAPRFAFAVPAGYDWIVSHGLVGFSQFTALEPWYFLGAAETFSVQDRWPKSRDPLLVAFARRQDNDDVACFELDAAKRNALGVRLIHADRPGGYDVLDWYGSFWDWFSSAVRDVREWSEQMEPR